MVRACASGLCIWMACAVPAFAQGPALGTTAPAAPELSPSAASGPVLELPTQTTGRAGSFYADAEYLLFWFKPVCFNVPGLTTGGTGVVGQPGTQIVIGGDPPHKFDFGATSGIRTTVGWQSGDGVFGVEVSGFLMDTASNGQFFAASANGSPASYLPYVAPDNSHQVLPFTVPGVVTGSSLAIGSTHVWGVESNLVLPFTVERPGCTLYGAFLAGGRYLDLTDRDRITNTLSLVDDPGAFAIGQDQIVTRNQFGGAQVGTTLGLSWGKCSLEYTLKLAAGLTEQARNIQGSPVLASTVESPLLVPGPLIALPSNIGRETAERVTVVPDIGVKARFELTPSCSLTVGYMLLYWNKVLCPGDQMDDSVNITQLPFHGPATGPALPAPMFVHTDYFAQGLDVGIQFRF
jgi:hypothetical protein